MSAAQSTDRKVTMTMTCRLILLVAGFMVSLAGADVCFRKYNAERDGCRGQIQGHTPLTADSCCSEGGQGHATQLMKQSSKNGKKWFKCLACPSSKDSEPAKKPSLPMAVVKPSTTGTGRGRDIKYIDEEVDGKLLTFQTNALGHSDDDGDSSSTKTTNVEMSNDLLGGTARMRKNEMKSHRSAVGHRLRQKIEDHLLLPSPSSSSSSSLSSITLINKTSDIAWSEWSEWGPCSATCDDHGKQQRTRFCLTGECVDGADFEEKICGDLQPCPVAGEWSQWSDWSSCNVTCRPSPIGLDAAEEGTVKASKRRTRICDNPAPKYGGSDCIGSVEEISECDEVPLCPVNGGWSIWKNWTACTTSCGEGLQTRSRQCDNPVPRHGGRPCEGLELESAPCIVRSICPVDGQWSEWSRMEACSAKPCSGQRGFRIRFRSCTNPTPTDLGMPCRGRSWIRESCYSNDFCTDKVDGGWCSWSDWSNCDDDVSLVTRERNCSCPPPVNGGNTCEGVTVEKKLCARVTPTPISNKEIIPRKNGCRAEGSGDDDSDIECDTEQDAPASNDDDDEGSAID